MSKEEKATYTGFAVLTIVTALGLLGIVVTLDRQIDRVNGTVNNLPTNLARVLGIVR
jgi:hypothetical protein